jgi:hypothetical protein
MAEVKLYDLFRQVDDSIKSGEYGNVVEICNKSKFFQKRRLIKIKSSSI